jgi:hypothetical protein
MNSSNRRLPPGTAAGSAGYDPSLDPIPQPMVTERGTETGWAEFDSLMNEELIAQDLQDAPDFEETQPLDRGALE